MDKNQSIAAFGALSQETRLDVIRLLIRAGTEGMAAGEIGDHLGVRQNTMSANLSVLAHAGLIKFVREGRSIRYFADFDGIKGLLTFLLRDCCGGRADLCQPLLDEIACGC
ncbi:metalloregulator ArsR/SmtB family transcription factor [Asticcacaulis sp. BYS171W]|uniref:Metalloregulator ArsR/SmtB family transcription factor n=1 Tax=Asticcacaulis aquaticus TaxID=2984212 RepID=A0ABT5HNV2_9CAUL|nr:metalloregulator ArsR/SmtB family transcription factor [Asticcacaulis aquaticus]MDC7681746.1 metalloregulator ArsR/SmtB family transcription factor [Asticcacaulis aquaticus]